MLFRRFAKSLRQRHKKPTLPVSSSSIEKALLHQGEIFILLAQEIAEAGVSLSVDNACSHFEPVPDSVLEGLTLLLPHRLEIDPARPLDLDSYHRLPLRLQPDVALNADPKWSVPGRNTLKIGFLEAAMPVKVSIAGKIEIEAHATPLQFLVGLAVHRGEGNFVVTIRAGDVETTHRIAFDQDRHGGVSMESFQRVSIDLPASAETTSIQLSIEAEGTVGNAEGGASTFFFLADPRVAPAGSASGVDEGLIYIGAPVTGRACWLRAKPAQRIAAGTQVSLITKDGTEKLLDAKKRSFRLHEDHGHTIVLSASEPGNFVVFIDGQRAFSLYIDKGPTHIRIPNEYLNGQFRMVSIWDQSSLQEYFSTYIHCPRILTPEDILRSEGKPPYPGPLGSFETQRYKGIKALLDANIADSTRSQLNYCLSVLERGHSGVRPKPIKFPKVNEPDVSIVIPAHNAFKVTYLALCSLLFAYNRASFEVILVDDASTDETASIEEIVSGIRIVRNETPQRFILACNSGVAKARGKFVTLLNNDVEVTAGWLDALIDAFNRFDKVGLVGSKLLYPDGRLQDGGGLIWKTGNPWNYGHGQNPFDPRFCYARQVDYLSGAAMMTTKEIWQKVGGLSDYLEPMYFEDTDFAFKIREAGYTTWYVPSSIVFHFEGMTSGTDTSTGFKRYQEVNRPKFKRRWAQAFRDFGEEAVNPDLEKDRGISGRILFIDNGVPRPDRDAGSFAALQEIRLVQSLGYKVTFLPQNLAHMGGYNEDLERMGVEVVYAPFYLSVAEYLEKHAAEYDAFFVTRYYVAQAVLADLRRLAPSKKILFNNADLHFLRELRTALSENNPAGIEAAQETRRRELEVMRKVDLVLSYNDVEHSVITSHTDGAVKVAKCPWVVEIPDVVPGLEGRVGLSFLGNYQHYPNVEAVEWFARSITPRFQKSETIATLTLYGSGITDQIRALDGGGVSVVGYVEHVAEAYDRHRVFVAPLLSGAGIKGKVLSALAHGIPCVLSPVAAEGVGLRHGLDCMIARTPEEWEEAVCILLNEDDLWHTISRAGRDFVSKEYSFSRGQDLMGKAFESVDLF